MAKLSETDIREMLERRAQELAIGPASADLLLQRGRRRRLRKLALVSATTLAAAATVGLSLNLLSDQSGSAPGASAGRPATQSHLRLVGYAVRPRADDHPHSGSGPEITLSDVREHVRCMRAQGFNVPDPTPQPGSGWSLIVDNAKARGLDFRSRKFREAAFVTCGLLGEPQLSGDMVIGGPHPKIDRFISCMKKEGYNLRAPRKDTSGRYDTDEWQFDLTGTGIDTGTRAWNEAMFVTCAPEQIR